MKVLKVALVVTFAFLFVNQAALADQEAVSEIDQGEKLVRQLWADMKERDVEAIEKYIAPGFQSVHQDGARDREQELELIANLNLGQYTLSDFSSTQTGPAVIIIYFVSVEETIEGQRLSSTPAARLSAFLETDNGWQWIVHANLKAMK